MTKRGAIWAVAVVTGALGMAACGSSSPPSSTTTTSTAIAPASALGTGTYTPAGSSGTPHYVVTISSANGTAFRGTVRFMFQDGTSSHVFDFSGTVSGQSATAHPTNVEPAQSGTQTVSSVPGSVQISIGSGDLTFEGCQAYLPQALSTSSCTFVGPK